MSRSVMMPTTLELTLMSSLYSIWRLARVLPLERNKVVFFPLSWTIVHPIDEASPLAGKSREELERDEAEILVLLTGVDETFEQTVQVVVGSTSRSCHVHRNNAGGPPVTLRARR